MSPVYFWYKTIFLPISNLYLSMTHLNISFTTKKYYENASQYAKKFFKYTKIDVFIVD